MKFFDKQLLEYESEPCKLRFNHIGQNIDNYIIKEQFPFGCLAINEKKSHSEEITTYKGNMMTIGFVSRKFIPACELEEFRCDLA